MYKSIRPSDPILHFLDPKQCPSIQYRCSDKEISAVAVQGATMAAVPRHLSPWTQQKPTLELLILRFLKMKNYFEEIDPTKRPDFTPPGPQAMPELSIQMLR